MTKQRTTMIVIAAVMLGIFGAGCGNKNEDAAANKPPAQIQADAQKTAADQAKMYQQKMGQQGQK